MWGVQVLEDIELRCPVVNVAESWLKKLYESPMIGESIVHGVDDALAAMGDRLCVEPSSGVDLTAPDFRKLAHRDVAPLARRG